MQVQVIGERLAKFFIFATFTGHFGAISADNSVVIAAILAKGCAAAKIANWSSSVISYQSPVGRCKTPHATPINIISD
jgi:hypothetical protein